MGKGEEFRIFMRYGGMKVTKNMVEFKNEDEVMENSKIAPRVHQFQGEIEFEVRFLTDRKATFNTFYTYR